MTAPTVPGIYAGIPDDVYHGDTGSLSSSQARRLLEVTPHRWRWEQDNPRPPKDAFDLGHVVHSMVLGTGAQPVDTGLDEWRTKDAKQLVASIRAAGDIPLKPKDYQLAAAMAAALRAHPEIAAVLTAGQPELSVYHHDPGTGIMVRARPDWTHWTSDTSAIVLDIKTSKEPSPYGFIWEAGKYGYHCQEAWYTDALAAHDIGCRFLFGVVCSEPPHETYMVEMPARAAALGAQRNRRAINLYTECVATGIWPSHDNGIHVLDLPETFYRREENINDQ